MASLLALTVMVVVEMVVVVIDVVMIVAGEPHGIWMQYFPLRKLNSPLIGSGGDCAVIQTPDHQILDIGLPNYEAG